MKQIIVLLCALLALSACVSNQAYKADQKKLEVLEATLAETVADIRMLQEEIFSQRRYALDMVALIESKVAVLDKSLATQAMLDSIMTEMDDIYFIMREYDNQFTDDIAHLYRRVDALQSELGKQSTSVVLTDTLSTEATEDHLLSSQVHEEITLLITEIEDAIEEMQDYIDDEIAAMTSKIAALQRGQNPAPEGTIANETQQPLAYDVVDLWSEDLTAINDEVKALKAEVNELREKLARQAENQLTTQKGKELSPAQTLTPDKVSKNAYITAKAFYDRREFDKAVTELNNFISNNPVNYYSPNAHYWIAESHYATGNLKQAIRDFELVISKYPESHKALDAKVKVGLCYWKMGDNVNARKELTQLTSDHPDYYRLEMVQKFLQQIPAN